MTHQVVHTGMNSEHLHDETNRAEVGCGLAREVAGGMFLSVFSERFVLVLRKLQIRKALGNERVARAWRGATERGPQGCLPRKANRAGARTGMASSLPPVARKEILLGLARV